MLTYPPPPLPPKPFIRLGIAWCNAAAVLKSLNERCVIYRDGGDLFELVGKINKDQHLDFDLRKISPRRLLTLMSWSCDFAKLDKRGDTWRRVGPPLKLARAIMAIPETWPFAQIRKPEPILLVEGGAP